MLSDKLAALAAHFHEAARRGEALDVHMLRRLSEDLAAHADDAVRLEAAQMPPGYTLAAAADLPGNVVRVDFVGHSLRNYRGFLQGVAGSAPGGAA